MSKPNGFWYKPLNLPLGGIQQLRGQDEGEGGSAKSPRLSTRVGGVGPLNVHVDQNVPISESISYHAPLPPPGFKKLYTTLIYIYMYISGRIK